MESLAEECVVLIEKQVEAVMEKKLAETGKFHLMKDIIKLRNEFRVLC